MWHAFLAAIHGVVVQQERNKVDLELMARASQTSQYKSVNISSNAANQRDLMRSQMGIKTARRKTKQVELDG